MRQLFSVVRIEAFDAELPQDMVERHAMQPVEVGPGQLAESHLAHVGPVQAAPLVSQAGPVGMNAALLAELARFSDDARSPVNQRAEDVERQRIDRQVAHWLRVFA